MRTKIDRATEEDVMAFIRAIAPQAPDLYLAAFSEKKALNDATELIADLKALVKKMIETFTRENEPGGFYCWWCQGDVDENGNCRKPCAATNLIRRAEEACK